nr:MAG TPA: hypothetical protein [Herelleviridae sp.]
MTCIFKGGRLYYHPFLNYRMVSISWLSTIIIG